MGKKQIQDGKEMNTDVGKETHTGWEGNTCRWEGNTYTVGRKCIHAPFFDYHLYYSYLIYLFYFFSIIIFFIYD